MTARDPLLAGLACAMTLGCFVSQAILNTAFIIALLVLASRIEIEKVRTVCRLPGLDRAIALYMLSFLVSGMAGIDPNQSFHYITELKRPVFAYVIATALSNRRDVLMLVGSAVFGASLSSLVAYKQWILGGTIVIHRQKTFYEPWVFQIPMGLSSSNNDLATLLVMAFGLAIVPVLFFPGSLNRRTLWTAALGSAIVYAGLLRTLARGAALASLASLALVGLMLRPRRVLVLFALMACLYPLLPHNIRIRHHDFFSMANYSNWYRVRMFELSGEMAREHGLLGIGRRNFGKMHQQIAKPGEEIAPHAHNNYLMMIVEQGVLGLIAFVWLQLAVLYYTAKHTLRDGLPGAERAVMGGCLFALLAFGLTGLFHFTMGDAMPASFHWIVVGLAYAVGERRTVAADLPDEAAPKPG